MKIAFFSDTYLPQINGVTNTLSKLEGYLDERGHDYRIYSPKYPDNSFEHKRIHTFKSIPFFLYPECRLSVPLYPGMCNVVDEFEPDIVHLVTPLGIGLMGMRYARERGLPIASSFTTKFDAYLKYYRFEYLEDLVWGFFKWFHNYCDINLCPSRETVNYLRRKGIHNLGVWSRGVDTQTYSPEHRDESLRSKYKADKYRLFLYVGRIAVEKDLDILIESIKRINLAFPQKTRFLIVGDGPYKEEMKNLSPPNVIYTGYLKGKNLAAMYASCDAFVFPSSTETFGNVVLEAMASGLPAITVNAGGVCESVQHGYNGLMSEARDVSSFTKSIAALLQNPDLVTELSYNARTYALERSWESVFDKLIEDFRAIVAKKLQVSA